MPGKLLIQIVAVNNYVPTPHQIEINIIEGGHVSPLEKPLDVNDLISRLID